MTQPKTKDTIQAILNLVGRDTNASGKPNAMAICNPDGGAISVSTYTLQTLTDGANIDWNSNSGKFAQVTLGGNRTFNAITNLAVGIYALKIIAGGSNRTLTWNANFSFVNDEPLALVYANTITWVGFFSDGINPFGISHFGFLPA